MEPTKQLAHAGQLVSTTNPLPVSLQPAASQAFNDRSGSIDTGGVSQEVAAANTSRRYLVFQNHSDTDMWLGIGAAAVADEPCVKLYANGGVYEPLVPPTEAIHVICAGTGKKFTCKEA